jgi:broad specificity polyphosphatase/5'/3'-nucleotidase SurE
VLITNDDGINSAAVIGLANSVVSDGWDVFIAVVQEEQNCDMCSIMLHKNLSCNETSLEDYCASAIGDRQAIKWT